MPWLVRVYRFLICAALVAALTLLFYFWVRVNATTVALSMLLLVLGIATRWGLSEGIFTSVLSVLGFNYFFLPPVGTFTIADPQNWVALVAFLVTAVTASQLSAQAKNRAEEASARSREIERLYQLSRALLINEETESGLTALTRIRDIFELHHVAFFESESGQVYSGDPGPLQAAELARIAASEEFVTRGDTAILPVRLGTRVIGSLGLDGKSLSRPERENIANLVAIHYEKTRALQLAATAEAGRQGERLKRFVLDGIAHDLKTPLTAIKTCISTLITIPPRTEEKRRELLDIIDEETERLDQRISEAIQLARIESQKVSLQRRPVRVAEQIEGLVGGLPDGVRFAVDAGQELTVLADPELLSQALKQLIENARKYSPESGVIDIRAEKEGASIRLSVADRGPGISPRELERIFEKFYRGSRGRSSTEGTGMGLAIARGIIEAHGGKIWAENRPGGGALFTVQLPAA